MISTMIGRQLYHKDTELALMIGNSSTMNSTWSQYNGSALFAESGYNKPFSIGFLLPVIALSSVIYFRLSQIVRFGKYVILAGHGLVPSSDVDDFSQYKSEEDLRKEMGWSDRAWRIARCQGPFAPLLPNRRSYEESKAKIPAGYELTQVNVVSIECFLLVGECSLICIQ